ncbi:MAG: hydantoinase B/oxoprolinase family protein, partial [Synechocystis sp.]|nr:hydantoinase B/oxoprolinase family protein [Synechocystis sp.]
ILSNRRRVVPFGLNGGEPGQPGENRLIRANGEEFILDSCVDLAMQNGDRLMIKTPGGGGFGRVG